jgi:hypothetical protein
MVSRFEAIFLKNFSYLCLIQSGVKAFQVMTNVYNRDGLWGLIARRFAPLRETRMEKR